MTGARPFHLAFPVNDLGAARAFYAGVLGCREGRASNQWIDFDLYGNQVTVHLVPGHSADAAVKKVDGHGVPIPHFGVVLTMADWHALRERIEAAGIGFGVAPHIRWQGKPGEQATMFFRDPSGNALEFKAFGDDGAIFAT